MGSGLAAKANTGANPVRSCVSRSAVSCSHANFEEMNGFVSLSISQAARGSSDHTGDTVLHHRTRSSSCNPGQAPSKGRGQQNTVEWNPKQIPCHLRWSVYVFYCHTTETCDSMYLRSFVVASVRGRDMPSCKLNVWTCVLRNGVLIFDRQCRAGNYVTHSRQHGRTLPPEIGVHLD